jgi:hypothetical protein
MNKETQERELFNRMLNHHIKSFSNDYTRENRDHHFKLYILTKWELWEFQEKNND